MRKKCFIILSFLLSIFLISCVTKVSPEQQDLDKVMDNWIRAFTTEDINLLMSTYWHDAVLVVVFGDNRNEYFGEDEIKAGQGGGFEATDTYLETSISVIDKEFGNEISEYTCEAEGPGFFMINRFKFEKRNGEWKIINQLVEPPPAE